MGASLPYIAELLRALPGSVRDRRGQRAYILVAGATDTDANDLLYEKLFEVRSVG